MTDLVPDQQDAPSQLSIVVPDRPDPEDLIASGWGRWVHDEIAAQQVGFSGERLSLMTLSGTTANDIPQLSGSITTLANRRYLITATIMIAPTTAGNCTTTILVDGAQVAAAQAQGAAGVGVTVQAQKIWVPTAGAHTVKAQAGSATGGQVVATLTLPSSLLIVYAGSTL